MQSSDSESGSNAKDIAGHAPIVSAPKSPLTPKLAPKPRVSAMLATRPLWQIVVGLGVGAIGLTGVVIGVFTLSGLALQGLGRAVAGLIAGLLVLILFGSIPAALTVFTLRTHAMTQQHGVNSGTASLALGMAIAIGLAIGVCSRLLFVG
ncbi:MAG: hypothetical protein HC795_00675 [Coleofasciculaceae cyanobacterium RL_1_1]|nr:hypothetical protein [Coleofasciculaceae cyanobacterium RL_1_1]